MNIANAKEQIKNAVRIYLQKDALGRYKMPLVHQRPVFLQGAPGLGKTAIMRQISNELGIGLVAYSMTHHTRQSAIGLPVIVQKEFGGKTYSVSEYTMSEIIASVYDCMEKTGCREGILFLDEINCISETLSPAMLLFLQYKTFGGHTLPEGWVVVTAGNQARYNKSVRDFDAATRDRLKYLVVEPDYESWKQYALERGISRTVISFLDIRPDDFYVTETTVEGFSVVTPRSWEDLSQSIRMHEALGIPVKEELVGQYLQNPTVARDFTVYYELYQKYRLAYDIEAILARGCSDAAVEEARKARADERLTLTGLLLEAVMQKMHRCNVLRGALKLVREQLVLHRPALESGSPTPAAVFADMRESLKTQANQMDESEQEGYLRGIEILEEMAENVSGLSAAGSCSRPSGEKKGNSPGGQADEPCSDRESGQGFELCRRFYGEKLDGLEQSVKETQQETGNLLAFLEEAFGDGNELGLAVSDLTAAPEAAAFIGQFLSMDFFKASSRLQMKAREDKLLEEIDLVLQ